MKNGKCVWLLCGRFYVVLFPLSAIQVFATLCFTLSAVQGSAVKSIDRKAIINQAKAIISLVKAIIVSVKAIIVQVKAIDALWKTIMSLAKAINARWRAIIVSVKAMVAWV